MSGVEQAILERIIKLETVTSDLIGVDRGWHAQYGTSFTGQNTNRPVFRTDLGLEFYYDGTRWLSTEEFFIAPTEIRVLAPYTSTNIGAYTVIWQSATESRLDMYLTRYTSFQILTNAHDASNFISIAFQGVKFDNTLLNYEGINTTSFSTSFTRRSFNVNTVVDSDGTSASHVGGFRLAMLKTGTPVGSLQYMAIIGYRLIAT